MKKKAFLAIIILLILSQRAFTERQFGQFDHRFALKGLGEEIKDARQSLHDVYYELVKRGYFDLSYNNNLVLDTGWEENVGRNNQVVLALVDWLEKRNDRDSRFLLKKINKLYYLELHHFFCKKDLHKNPGARIASLCQDLYQFSIPVPGVGGSEWEMPFRTHLTKIALLISAINHLSQIGYYEKTETMVYALGKVKQEMLILNEKLHDIKSIDEAIIKEFIELLEVHAVQVPIVGPSMIRRIVFWGIILSVICGAGYILYDKALREWITNRFKKGWDDFCNGIESLVEKAGEAGVKGALKGMVAKKNKDGEVEYDFTPEAKFIGEKIDIKKAMDEFAKKNPRLAWWMGNKNGGRTMLNPFNWPGGIKNSFDYFVGRQQNQDNE